MRKSPVPAARSSFGKPEVNADDPRSPDRPAKPPRVSADLTRVSDGPSPQPSPRAPPRPPSIKSALPPPRPPPPSKKDNDITINYPGETDSPSRSRPASDRDFTSGVAPPRPRPPIRSEPSRSSMRNITPYDSDMNPFGDDDETNNDDFEETLHEDLDESKEEPIENSSLNPFDDDFDDEEEEDISFGNDKAVIEVEAPETPPPPPQRVTQNPFFTASIKKKAAPLPPQRGRISTEIPSPSSSSSSDSPGKGQSIYANMESTDSGMVTLDSLPTTSGSTNEKPADETDAPPITIVSVCL